MYNIYFKFVSTLDLCKKANKQIRCYSDSQIKKKQNSIRGDLKLNDCIDTE